MSLLACCEITSTQLFVKTPSYVAEGGGVGGEAWKLSPSPLSSPQENKRIFFSAEHKICVALISAARYAVSLWFNKSFQRERALRNVLFVIFEEKPVQLCLVTKWLLTHWTHLRLERRSLVSIMNHVKDTLGNFGELRLKKSVLWQTLVYCTCSCKSERGKIIAIKNSYVIIPCLGRGLYFYYNDACLNFQHTIYEQYRKKIQFSSRVNAKPFLVPKAREILNHLSVECLKHVQFEYWISPVSTIQVLFISARLNDLRKTQLTCFSAS